MIKYARFKDSTLERDMNENGYVHIHSFLSNEEVYSLNELFNHYHTIRNGGKGFWFSVENLSEKEAREFNLKAGVILKPKVEKYFDDAHLPIITLLNKYPGNESHMDAHRDCSVLDEEKFGFRNMWIPLVDTDKNNGALFVLPRSHKYFNELYPIGIKWPYNQFSNLIVQKATTLQALKGDLLVYDQSMLHGSWKNQTQKNRPVVHFGIIPEEAEMLFYKIDSEGPALEVSAYSVKPPYSPNLNLIERLWKFFKKNITYKKYTEKEFDSLLCQIVNTYT